jgi:hypothetical protein
MKRDPRAKPGELRAAWSESRKHGYGRQEMGWIMGDLVYAWGDGCASSDGRLLHGAFAMKQFRPYVEPGGPRFDPSLLEELHRRGYDLTTLRFSIRKRPTPPDAGARRDG